MKRKILGISLILISIIGYSYLKLSIYYDIKNHEKIIDSIFISGEPNKTNYVGYIEIDSVSIKRGIVNGINSKILDNNDIGMIRNNNIILAGHGVDNVFGNLNNILINDKIKIYLDNQIYFYTVYNKIIIEKDNLNYLNQELVLITCTDDDKRLLILAKKRH